MGLLCGNLEVLNWQEQESRVTWVRRFLDLFVLINWSETKFSASWTYILVAKGQVGWQWEAWRPLTVSLQIACFI